MLQTAFKIGLPKDKYTCTVKKRYQIYLLDVQQRIAYK